MLWAVREGHQSSIKYSRQTLNSLTELYMLSAAFPLQYSRTSDKGPSEIGTTSLQGTLVSAPC